MSRAKNIPAEIKMEVGHKHYEENWSVSKCREKYDLTAIRFWKCINFYASSKVNEAVVSYQVVADAKFEKKPEKATYKCSYKDLIIPMNPFEETVGNQIMSKL